MPTLESPDARRTIATFGHSGISGREARCWSAVRGLVRAGIRVVQRPHPGGQARNCLACRPVEQAGLSRVQASCQYYRGYAWRQYGECPAGGMGERNAGISRGDCLRSGLSSLRAGQRWELGTGRKRAEKDSYASQPGFQLAGSWYRPVHEASFGVRAREEDHGNQRTHAAYSDQQVSRGVTA